MAAAKSTRKAIKTELQLGKLKSTGKSYDVKIHYSSGLYIRVGATGTKSYRWDRGRCQKPRHITYGQYPALPLKEARDEHEKLQQQYKDGAVIEIDADAPKTIKDLLEKFYAGRIVPNRKRPETVKQVLNHDILPFIGSIKVRSVNTMLVHSLVNKVISRGAEAHAGRVLAILKQMLGYGIIIGVLDHNPAQPLKKKDMGIGISQRNRVLEPNEINMPISKVHTNCRHDIISH